ncbi:Gag polyprotein [Trachymyrmex septentrionalis]|uniref:Gag polyprotein n=2 Tax=Trachymyrmex septentrionalis TaxID=34720 RepID=A0A151JTY2_9HYME|nr:Gag polyprotein [Trachymyrmex septentrionalis]
MIRCDEGGPSYADVMSEVRTGVPLDELGITDTRVRRAQNGGLLVEIPGEDAGTKADSLSEKLNSLFKNREVVRVIRLVRRTEFRLLDLDESVTAEEIRTVVVARGKASPNDVCVGPLRPSRGGQNSSWLQCPETCTDWLLKDGGLRVGWSRVRLIPLAKRKLQCYRCFAVGHTRTNCRSTVDRSSSCFNCGKEGHAAVSCRASPHCPVCAARNLPARYRVGGEGCAPYNSPVRVTVAAGPSYRDARHNEHGESSVPVAESVPPVEEELLMDTSNG